MSHEHEYVPQEHLHPGHEHHHEHEHHHHHHHEHETFEVHPCDGDGHEHHHHEDGSCCCEQHAKEFHGIDKAMLFRLIFAVLCYLAVEILPVSETPEIVFLILCAVAAGYDIVFSAVKNLFTGHFFDEYFLMSFAAVAAFVIGEYEEAAAVFLLYRIGAFCQSYAIRHSRTTIQKLTGKHSHDDEQKASNPFIARFARIYTPVILVMAVLIALILPLAGDTALKDAVYRALTFLVLACPCAIVISVPLTYFAGIGAASHNGILFHDARAVDTVAREMPGADALHREEQNGRMVCTYAPEGETALILTEPEKLPMAASIARRTRLIAMENVWFTILVKVTVLVLAVLGVSALWFAVFADSGVTVVVVLNSLRAFHAKKK